MSCKIATAPHGDAGATHDGVGFWLAAALQWGSPKCWLISASAFGTFLHADAARGFVPSLYFGVIFVLAAPPSCIVWLAFGATVQRFLQSERAANIGEAYVVAELRSGISVVFIAHTLQSSVWLAGLRPLRPVARLWRW